MGVRALRLWQRVSVAVMWVLLVAAVPKAGLTVVSESARGVGVTCAAGLTVEEGVSQCQGCLGVGVTCGCFPKAGLTVVSESVSVRVVWVWVLRVLLSPKQD